MRFDAVEDGTRVSVTQALLPGGETALFFWPNALRLLSHGATSGAASAPLTGRSLV